MLKTKNFTYIHPMKCGGTFVNDIILDSMESKVVEFHLPRRALNHQHNFITSVRNPFDWYVSVYYYLRKRLPKLFKHSDSFKETIIPLLDLNRSNLHRGFIDTDWDADVIMNFKTKDFEDYQDDIGFYSWYWHRMVNDKDGNSDDVHVMKVENLREDLINTLSKFCTVSNYTRHLILTSPNSNVEESRKHYRDYYDQELIDMVYKMDKTMFDRFGYEF